MSIGRKKIVFGGTKKPRNPVEKPDQITCPHCHQKFPLEPTRKADDEQL